MELWLWALIGIMAVIIAALLVKIYFLHKAAGEIVFTNTASGLGLSIARTLVERMGGTITAQYKGSKLSICIVLPPR